MTSDGLLCDSSSLISLTSSCLDSVLYFLRDDLGVKFYITPSIEEECVTSPLSRGLKEHSFSARKIERAIKDNVISKIESKDSLTSQFLDCANNMFFMRARAIPMVHKGEAEVLAISKEVDFKTLLIDERTTRMLIESPFRIKEHLEIEFHVNVMVDKNNLSKFSDMAKGLEVIRASELLILAYEYGFMDGFGERKKDALEAALYKLKYSGCSIRFDEINQFIRALNQ